MRGHIILVGCLAVLLSVQVAQGGAYLDGFEVPADAGYVGAGECIACHEDIGEFYAHSPHSPDLALAVPGRPEASACEACHGPGSLHVDEGGEGWILTGDDFAALDDAGHTAMCTQCHVGVDLKYADGPHAGTGVSCADCHGDQVHFGGAARPAGDFRNGSEFCLQCHAPVTAQFRMPHRHRVLEGQVSCADCHDHHGGVATDTWGGLNDTCLQCHAEKAGPFVFEHGGVTGESCLECHSPHGSQHDALLVQDGNGLCLQCHYDVTFNAGDGFDLGGVSHENMLTGERRCYDCHREVHGSNISPAYMDQ